MEEYWRPIKGFEGYYEVSNKGRIRSKERTIMVRSSKGLLYERPLKGVIKKTTLNKGGYVLITLRKGGKQYNYSVHRIVAQTFIPNPNNLPEVNHKDENKTNNCVENLEWCDHSYNNSYGSKPTRMSKLFGIPVIGFDNKHKYGIYFPSALEANKFFVGKNTSHVWRATNHKVPSAYGYKWEYCTPEELNLPPK